MKDISSKPETLRTATASGCLHAPADVIARIPAGTVEKGNPIEIARVAGIMAAKRTPDIIPLCHPIPLQNVVVSFEISETRVDIESHVQLIASTGAEMEALAAVSAAALTLYDMLKPYAGADMQIDAIRLTDKTGGKSHYRRQVRKPTRAAILDLTAPGRRRDPAESSAELVREILESSGLSVGETESLTADAELAAHLGERLARLSGDGIDLIITLGGTGIREDDRVIEIVEPLLQRKLPGIGETMRAYGQQRTPYALISRSIAGMIGHSLVITLPGSRSGAGESLQAIRAGLVHLLDVMPRDA